MAEKRDKIAKLDINESFPNELDDYLHNPDIRNLIDR